MENKRQYVPALDMHYEFDAETGLASFDDGVIYGVGEMIILSSEKVDTYTARAVHLIKKHFNGKLLTESESIRPTREDYARKRKQRYERWTATGFFTKGQERRFYAKKRPQKMAKTKGTNEAPPPNCYEQELDLQRDKAGFS